MGMPKKIKRNYVLNLLGVLCLLYTSDAADE